MITNINDRVLEYYKWQQAICTAPTQKGLSEWLGFSPSTMHHIITGQYARGKPYTENPTVTRKVRNNDFPVVREACEDIRKMRKSREMA